MATAHFEHILCPTDFSVFSNQALRHALTLARRFGSRLKIVHVIPNPYAAAESVYGAAPWIVDSDAEPWIDNQMRAFLEPAREARVDHEIEVRSGEPWREIVAAAEEMRADLVVLGTHGRSGLEHLFLGSVAEKLIRRLPCPVLTVSHEEGRTWAAPGLVGKILCATDFSETSTEAARLGFALAEKHGAEVTLLHVVENLGELTEAAARVLVDMEALRSNLEGRAQERLREASGGETPGGIRIEPRAVFGAPYKEILRVAATERFDLIVIGAQGPGVLERLFSGSNAQHVIRAATCPVLTVRPVSRAARSGSQETGLTLAEGRPVS